jgi:hypothetical protein
MSSRSSHECGAFPSRTAIVGRLGTGADVHNRTDDSGPIWDDRGNHGRVPASIKTMLFTIAVLIAGGGALIIHRARAAGRANQANLGWMSAQWLAEHRASHLS